MTDEVRPEYAVGDTGRIGFSYDTVSRNMNGPRSGIGADDDNGSVSFDLKSLSLGFSYREGPGSWLVERGGLGVRGGSYAFGFDPVALYMFSLTNATISIDGQTRVRNGAVVPLPAGAALLGSAMLGALALRRRRR